MKQTAFGFEHENGTIVYTCVKEYTLDELFEHVSKRSLPHLSTIMNTSLSLDDYFSPDFFEKEHTIWRIVFLLDGNVVFRHVSKDGDLLYRIYGN